ncbi:MAG: bifunctional DNA primase/polymerase [Candidatus Thiodiazotropha sp.]|nr:bifunctional DNA primase/polymerase [Candidatus Thiodiazotropha sp.]
MSKLKKLDWALRYHEMGWAVIPISSKNKRPLTKWKEYQTEEQTPELIEKWWGEWPEADIGIITGEISDLVVVDCDHEDAIKAVRDMGLSSCIHSRTKRGEHLFFKHPGHRVQNQVGWLGMDGVDIRGDGGYVKVYPSDGYSWDLPINVDINDIPFEMPVWESVSIEEANRQHGSVLPDLTDVKVWEEIPDEVFEGERNHTMTRIVGKLIQSNPTLWGKDLLIRVWDENNQRCKPPLDQDEIKSITLSVMKRHIEAHPEEFDANRNRNKASPIDPENPFAWVSDFIISREEVEQFSDPKWVYENLIIQSHMLVLAAEPGAGKTTICTHLAGELCHSAQKVIYVLADIGQGDVRHYHDMAEQNGWSLLLPDLKIGESMDTVVEKLKELNESGADLSGVVIFFDTMKKMADVISKRSTKELMTLLRSLTAKGLTAVLIAHTNKYKSEDGELIFEGTHDVMTDCDELIYLYPKKNPDGSLTVSTKPSHKVRGKFEPITFEIGSDRSVKRVDEHVDVQAALQIDAKLMIDQPVIDGIIEAIEAGSTHKSAIIDYCNGLGHPQHKVREVLDRYSSGVDKRWSVERAKHNKMIYSVCITAPSLE